MVKQKDVFNYLDMLRDSGITNMLGATPYIQERFGIGEKEARDYLVAWIESFKDKRK